MNRTHALTAAAIAALAVTLGHGAPATPGALPADIKKPDAAGGHKTAVFNMAGVMRDFNQAKYQVWLLNKKKEKLSVELVALRKQYTDLQREFGQPNQKHPDEEMMNKKMLELARKVEDADRKINQQLNDDARLIIVELYDKIKEIVDRTAAQEGFQLVLAYPDAITPAELDSPYIKELKLKPPAAQPFFVAPEINITARVIAVLNEKYPAIDPETKKLVDVSKLDVPNAGNGVPGAPPPPMPKARP